MKDTLISKRIISILMVLFLLLSIVPVSASWQQEEPSTYEDEAYIEEPETVVRTPGQNDTLTVGNPTP